MKKVLLFAPFGRWLVHHQVDGVIGASLMQRGCEVKAFTCDGIFVQCPISNQGELCYRCISDSKMLFKFFSIPCIKIGSFIDQQKKNFFWNKVKDIAPNDLKSIVIDGFELARWIEPSMHSFFMSEYLDYSNEHIVTIKRKFLLNALLTIHSFKSCLKEFYPDYVICYSGFHLYYRVVFELCNIYNIPVLVHERGAVDNSFVMINDESIHTFSKRLKHWQSYWKDIPLTDSQCNQIKKYLLEREAGKQINDFKAYHFKLKTNIYQAFRIPPGSKIIVIFPTTDWEIGITNIETPLRFSSQIQWFEEILEQLKNENIYVIIKHHPSLIGKNWIGQSFLSKLFKFNQKSYLYKNLRISMPFEEISSYYLLNFIESAIILRSTIGIEAITRGIDVISELDCFRNIAGIKKINSFNYKEEIFLSMERTSAFDIEKLRQAYRGAYHNYYRLLYVFSSIGIKEVYNPHIKIESLDDLQNGKDKTLDTICNHIIYNTPLYPIPNKEDMQRTDEEETKFLKQEFISLKEKILSAKNECKYYNPMNEPEIDVIRLRKNGNLNFDETLLKKSLKISRHRKINVLQIPYPSYCINNYLINEINIVLKEAKAKYIYFAIDNIQLDESFFASAVDFLDENENSSFDGILSGVWLFNEKEISIDEFFTKRNDTNDCSKIFLKNQSYESLLSLFVWRKKSFCRLFSDVLDNKNLFESICNKALFKNPILNVHKTLIPNIIIYPPKKSKFLKITKHPQTYCYQNAFRYIDDIYGLSSPEAEQYLFEKIKSLSDQASILEIGCNQGRLTATIAFACVGTDKKIFSIDTFADIHHDRAKVIGNSFFDVWLNNMDRLRLYEYVKPLIGFSHEVLKQLSNTNIKFDFVFINDSYHKNIIKNFELVYPLVKDYGWIALNDVNSSMPREVWIEKAISSLSYHEYCKTIICGQKDTSK